MNCPHCNTKLAEGTKFCPECGNKVVHEMKTIQLKCKACGGTLTVDTDKPVLVCPFCQSSELIDESDEVTVNRIWSNTYKEVEFEKLKHEERQEERQEQRALEKEREEEARRKAFDGKRSKWANFCLFLAIVCFSSAANSFQGFSRNIPLGIVSAIQGLIFLATWLTGRKNSYGKTSTKHKLCAIAGCLVFGFVSVLNVNGFSMLSNSRHVAIPSITAETVTSEKEGIFCYPVRNYVGLNAATIGKARSWYRIDEYGDGEIRLVFIAEDGSHVDALSDEQLKEYVVYAQNLSTDDNIITVSDRYSNGEPSSIVDYQNYEEVLLYVKKIGSDVAGQPSITTINPSLNRRTYYVRDYVGRNAATIGRSYGNSRIDEYGNSELKLQFSAQDGTFIDTDDISVLRQYVVTDQDIAPNTELVYTFDTYSNGSETDIVEYQNYETITLTITKLDESVIALMPVVTPAPTEEPEPEKIEFNLQYKVGFGGSAEITGFSGTGNYAYIPRKIDGHEINSIGDSAFKNCTTLEYIYIADELEIGDYAFAGCTALKEVSIPHDTKQIGDHAFEGCTSLHDLTIWDVETIGDYAFAGCTALKDVSIPHDTIEIGNHAFEGCTGIIELILWDVETIGKYAFSGCTNIDSVSIPHDTKYIKEHAFDGCTGITELIIWDIDTIYGYAFAGCTGIEKVSIPHDAKSIKAHAFDGCINLASKTIWDDDTVVDSEAFSNCPKLGTGNAAPKTTVVAATSTPVITPIPTATPSATPKSTVTPKPTPVPTLTPNPTPEICYQKGSKGDEVKVIQEYLISLGFLNGAADGDFGNMTKNAVMEFQEANGLTATGIITNTEYELLSSGEAEPKPTPSPTPYTSIYDVAVVRKLNGYSIYYLIDYDGKTARNFYSNDTGVLVGSTSGNLSSGLKITYRYAGDSWMETLKYKSGSTTKVVLIDSFGSEWDFAVVSVADAEKVINKSGYHDMN